MESKRGLPETSYIIVSTPQLAGLKNCEVMLLYNDSFRTWRLDHGHSILNYESKPAEYPSEVTDEINFANFVENRAKALSIRAFIAMDNTTFNRMHQAAIKKDGLFVEDYSLMKQGIFLVNK